MPFVPNIKLYQDDGATPVYHFEHVTDLPDLMIDNPDFVTLQNKRAKGSINIPAGDKSYEFKVSGVLIAASYVSLVSAMSSLRSTVKSNTRYVLKIDTSSTTTESLNVMRTSIVWEGPERKTKIQRYTVTFLVDSW